MRFLSNRRFRTLFKEKRFLEAIAYSGDVDPSLTSDVVWSLYRAGCFRSVVEFGYAPRSGRDAVAVAVSLAACGRADEAGRLLREARLRGDISTKQLHRAAGVVARYGPAVALDLLDMDDGRSSHLGLYLSLLIVLGEEHRLAERMAEGITPEQMLADPDLMLLQANLLHDPAAVVGQVNAFLARFHLAAVARKTDHLPLSATNMVSPARSGTERGPLVTVTMPAYNTAERIGPAIQSLLAQTYRDIEVVVVDDCSTDATVSIVRQLAARDERVRLLERSQNGGPYAARNMALEAGRGVFAVCHDSDDWAHPEKIARQVAPLLTDPKLGFTMSKWVRIQDDGRFCAAQVYPLTRINPASPLFRREAALARAGYYETVRTGADSEYMARLKLVFGDDGWTLLPQPLAFGAQRPGSLTTDAETGTLKGEAMNAERLGYWEAWRKRHANALRRRRSLRIPYSG